MNNDQQQRFHDNLTRIRQGLPTLRLIAAKKAHIMAHTTTPGSKTNAPIPLNLGAWQLLQDIQKLTKALAKATHLPHRRLDTETLLKGITQHETQLLQRPDAKTITALADQAAHRLDRMLNPPDEETMIGPCPQCGCELWCTPLELASGYKACDRCGREAKIKDVHRAQMLKLAVCGAHGTAGHISAILRMQGLNIKRNTITQWGRRGVIQPVDYDADGNPVYLVWDVWQAYTAKKGA